MDDTTTPDPTSPGRSARRRPARQRPAARTRLAVTFGSIGALAGLTAGLALDGSSGSTETAAAPDPAPPTAQEVARPAEWDEEEEDESWLERIGAEVGARLAGDEGEGESWLERVGAEVGERLGEYDEDDDDEGWGTPVPGRSGGEYPQTRSSGS